MEICFSFHCFFSWFCYNEINIISKREADRLEPFKFSYKTEKDDAVMMNIYNSGYQKCAAGYHMGPLTKTRYLIHHVVSGKGYYVVGEQTFSIAEGDTFLIYPNTVVSYYADEKDPWEYYWVGFLGADVKMLLNKTDFTKERPVIRTEHSEELKELLLSIYRSSGGEYYKHVRMTGYLYLFLSRLVEYSSKPEEAVDLSLEYAKKAVDFIAENYAQPISVVDIASHLGVSRSHLYRVFVKNLSVSPQVYLEQFRVRQSLVLLEQTPLPISEIAASVGYEDQLHFSKVFKKQNGVSPKVYQKQLRLRKENQQK